MNESQMHYARWKKTQKATYYMSPFIWHPGKGKTIGTEKR